MKKDTRKQNEIINEIKDLVKSPGYIVALCMTLFEDHHVAVGEVDKVNVAERLSTKESSFLVSLFLQNESLITQPTSPKDVLKYKNRTSELFKELHLSYLTPFNKKMSILIANIANGNTPPPSGRADQKNFFGDAEMIKEAVSYSDTGAYDIQYLNFLGQKYKYDKEWLVKNKNFDFEEVCAIVSRIKDVLSEKSQKVHFLGLKENLDKIVSGIKNENRRRFSNKLIREMMTPIEFYQYKDLFGPIQLNADTSELDNLREQGWMSFYDGIVDLFSIHKSDLSGLRNVDAFLDNFSFVPGRDSTDSVRTMETYNIINSRPIIKLDEDRYFIPINFILFESVYETPYYWMCEDVSYRDQLGENRGQASEDMVCSFLSTVFGTQNTYRSILIKSGKDRTDTDIDVLCVLGNKALCVQVKSKKITQLAKNGDTNRLLQDFKGAVQDAYEQGLICRTKIIEKSARFFDTAGNEIKFADPIDEIFTMVVTSENYPALTHQAYVLLDKQETDPFPLAITAFDLHLLTHYLNNPYHFLYYVRQRISLMDQFRGANELTFLAYHLKSKLSKNPEATLALLDNDYALSIDRNYYCHLYGINDPEEDTDTIKHSWINDEFQELLSASLKNLVQA